MLQMKPLRCPWSKTELTAIVKEFPKSREEPQKLFEKVRAIIRAYDPSCQSLLTCAHVGRTWRSPQKWIQEANW